MDDPRRLREAAARCFRLAKGIGGDADSEFLIQLGRDLERRAKDLEAMREADDGPNVRD